ncbi:MAG: hypothetical protein KKG70_03865 [Proteobacteria bacterium]|nr:hypothetical protein [Pseudomonadota bacterium]
MSASFTKDMLPANCPSTGEVVAVTARILSLNSSTFTVPGGKTTSVPGSKAADFTFEETVAC